MTTGNDADSMPIEDRVGHLIKRAEQALMSTKSHALSATGLTVPQYSALLVLSQKSGISGAELARRCVVTPQTMANLLSTLEHKGLVSREPSPVHSKVFVTRLTRPGHALLRKADSAAVTVERALAAEYTPEDLARLRELLGRAVDALEAVKAGEESA